MPDIGTQEITSGRSSTFEFTDTVPEDAEQVEVTFEASLPNGTASTVTRTINVLSLSDVINAKSISVDGTPVGGRTIEGSVTVQNDDDQQHTVTLLQNGSQIGSSDIYSGRDRSIDFEYQLPDVNGQESVDIVVGVEANGQQVSSITNTVSVQEAANFVSITGTNFPDTAASGETVGGRDAQITVDSSIDDATVDLRANGSSIGSATITRAGEEEVRVEVQMPEVDDEQVVSLDIEAVVEGTVADTASESITVQGPLGNVNIESLVTPDQLTSGESGGVTATVSNSFSESLTVELEYNGSVVDSSSISDGRSSELGFEYTAPQVEGTSTETISVSALVDGQAASTESSSVRVSSPASKFTIQGMSSPSEMVGGETAEISTTVTNSSNSEYGVELIYDGSVVDSANVGGGRTSTLTFNYTAPNVDMQQTVEPSVEVIVQGQTAGTDSTTITVRNVAQFIDITDVQAPSEVVTGKSATVTTNISNDHDERVDIQLEYEGSIVNEGSNRADWEAGFDFVYDAPEVEGSTTDTIEVLAIVDEKVASSGSTQVTVVQPPEDDTGDDTTDDRVIDNHIKVDTEAGTITVDSSYDSAITIDGNIRGSSVELGSPVESKVAFLPGVLASAFEGEIPAGEKVTLANFNRLRHISVETGRAFTWTIDGQEHDTTRSFSQNFLVGQ